MDTVIAKPPLPLRRVALLVEYEGTLFRGLQRQEVGDHSIQSAIEAAAQKLGSHDPGFFASGRTDAGVHALGQVVAISLPERLEEQRIGRSMNACLPHGIHVRRAVPCDPSFNPRFNAIMRSYEYRLAVGAEPNPMERRFVAWKPGQYAPELLQAAAAAFLGKWEMKEWRSSACQATRTFLTISAAGAVPPIPDTCNHWRFRFSARSFLHHQVRFMIGGILAVAGGKIPLHALSEALAAGKRPPQAIVEAACGLCLMRIDFAEGKNPFTTNNPSAQD